MIPPGVVAFRLSDLPTYEGPLAQRGFIFHRVRAPRLFQENTPGKGRSRKTPPDPEAPVVELTSVYVSLVTHGVSPGTRRFSGHRFLVGLFAPEMFRLN